MSSNEVADLEIDEIGSAIQARLLVSTLPEPSPQPEPAAPAPAAAKPKKEEKKETFCGKKEEKKKEKPKAEAPKDITAKYDRWNLRPAESIDYGHVSAIPAPESKNGGYYITTAINYTNGPAHMGHAYEATTADCFARFARLQNGSQNAYFVTGSDEHGQKIANTAEAEGKEPIEICDKVRLK